MVIHLEYTANQQLVTFLGPLPIIIQPLGQYVQQITLTIRFTEHIYLSPPSLY